MRHELHEPTINALVGQFLGQLFHFLHGVGFLRHAVKP
jgi:hypothetical protein